VYPPRDKSTTAASGKDLYQVLSVARKASRKEIHRAYRTLARKYHPDLNPGNEAAAQKFREVQEAYEVLSDPGKRKAYDYYGSDFGDRIPSKPPEPGKPPRGPRQYRAADYTGGGARNAPRGATASAPYRPAASFPRFATRARLGSLVVAFVFVVGAIFYLMLPDPAVPEFKRAQEALRHVTSWKVRGHMNTSGTSTGEFLDEVSCPASEHIVQHLRSTAPGEPVDLIYETITIGNDRYFSYGRTTKWARLPSGGLGPSSTCASLQRAQDANGLPQFSLWLSNMYVFEKGDVRKTEQGNCREWKIVRPGGFSSVPVAEFVCLGVKDHLPRFRGNPGTPAELEYYDWNVPIEIVAPDLDASP
jgi:hypothetical protein